MFDYIIVGAGLAGCVMAERLAHKGTVLLIDKKNHIGGTCYDYYNNDGILIHKYGPHIFNTNDESVWNYIRNFTNFSLYHHRVLGIVEGKKVPIPFNLDSIDMLFPKTYASKLEEKLLSKYGMNKKIPIMELQKQDDVDLKFLANYIYNYVFLYYTQKQWGMTPAEVGGSAMARIPFYISRDDRYFQNRFQGIPQNGYTKMFEAMLDNPNISLMLNTNYHTILSCDASSQKFIFMGQPFNGKIIFTAPLDELFNYKYGSLPYRTLDFVFETYDKEYFQEICTINYPNDYLFTRITEFKHMTGQQHKKTTIVKEFPKEFDYRNKESEPYYPIPKEENETLYNRYLELSTAFSNLVLVGRLANYKYFTMSDTISKALEIYEKILR